jgi:hypothetical protein
MPAAAHPLPQVQLFQTFATTAAAIDRAQRAWLIGPNADLHRFAIDSERPDILVGTYDPAIAATYVWPARTPGGLVDQAYARVYIKDAELRYLQELRGAGVTIAPVSGRTNQIRAATSLNFRSVPGIARSASLGDRDVQVGDRVTITGTASSVTSTLRTFVRGFAAEPVAAVVGTRVSGTGNAAATTLGSVITNSALNQMRLAATLTNFNGLVDGILVDTFTVTITRSSTGNDLTTARARIQSASGIDYVEDWTPPAADAVATVGTRGLQLGFTVDTLDTDPAGTNLIAGQVFTVVVTDGFAVPAPTSGGTYTGTNNTNYVVEVIQGGLFADSDTARRPRIAVRTASGVDGQTSIALLTAGVVAIGTQGVTLDFSGIAGLRKGDTYSIPVTAATTGRVSTLLLGHELDATLLAATDLDLELAIVSDVEVPRYQAAPTPRVCWTPSSVSLTLVSDIQVYHSSYTVNGAPTALPIVSGSVYIEYREWLTALVGELLPVTTTADLDQIPGPLDPDNPLKWHAAKTIGNANSSPVYVTAVANPASLDSWTAALQPGTDVENVHNVVPISEAQDVIDLIVSHVASQSGPGRNQFRRAFVALPVPLTAPIVTSATSTNSAHVLATVADEPTIAGTQYLRVVATSGNISFDTAGVRPGDLARIGFNIDPLGVTTYREYVIDAVVSATALRLVTGPDIPLSVAERLEIHRVNNRSELIAAIGQRAAAYGSRQVSAVFVNTQESNVGRRSFTVAAAAVAGLASGVAPHQALTNVSLADLDELFSPGSSRVRFTRTELEALAGYGVWIVDRTSAGVIYTAEGLTTDMSDLNRSSEMLQRNLNSISRATVNTIKPYLGRTNLVDATLRQIRADLVGQYEGLRGPQTALVGIGSQLVEYTIQELRADLFQRDKLIVNVDFLMPYAINRVAATLQVV